MIGPVSFLSDFGTTDEFVGVVHGVIARIAPAVRVIDVSHHIPQGDVRAGALTLLRAVQYLPNGVALAVVDPGVGTSRRAIAAETDWGVFIGPDNGVMAPAVAMIGGAHRIVSLENPELHLPSLGATFDGRDLFGPAAAVIASGQAKLEDLGPAVARESVTPLMLPLPDIEQGQVRGEVLWVDHFGNAQTNIGPDDLSELGLSPGADVIVSVGASDFRLTWVAAYGEVQRGEGLLHIDSYGQMAIAVNGGRAEHSFPIGTRVAVAMRPAVGPEPAAPASTPLDMPARRAQGEAPDE